VLIKPSVNSRPRILTWRKTSTPLFANLAMNTDLPQARTASLDSDVGHRDQDESRTAEWITATTPATCDGTQWLWAHRCRGRPDPSRSNSTWILAACFALVCREDCLIVHAAKNALNQCFAADSRILHDKNPGRILLTCKIQPR